MSILVDLPPVLPANLTAMADGNGSIHNEEFVLGVEEIDIHFFIQAQGEISGLFTESSFSAEGIDPNGGVKVAMDKGNYSPGEIVVITGTGWMPGESVSLSVSEIETGVARAVLSATANGNGMIHNEEFVIGEEDIGTYFLLQAQGQTSALSVETQFADAPIEFAPGGRVSAPGGGGISGRAAASDLAGDGNNDLAMGSYGSNNVSVLINITTVKHPPAANNDAYTTDENVSLGVGPPRVLINDSDPDDNPMTAVLVLGPTKGSLTLNPDGSFQYVPNLNWCGTDSLPYKTFDGTAYSNVATVDVAIKMVNYPPAPAINPPPLVSGECPGPVTVPVPTATDDHDGVIMGTTSDPVTYAVTSSMSTPSRTSMPTTTTFPSTPAELPVPCDEAFGVPPVAIPDPRAPRIRSQIRSESMEGESP